jgi:hypothetical protein
LILDQAILADLAVAITPKSYVRVTPIAHSDDCSHRFRSKPATCSDRSQPGIPMIPAG